MPITNAPNQATPGNRKNGSFPQPAGPSPVNPPNHGPGGDGRANTFASLAAQGSPINPPNAGLKWTPAAAEAEHNKTYNAPAAVEPGKGAIPVNPGLAGRSASMPASLMRGK